MTIARPRTALLALLTLAAFLTAGCPEPPPPMPGEPPAPRPVWNPFRPKPADDPQFQEKYTILLYKYTGENHAQQAEKGRAAVERISKWTDIFTFADGEGTLLCRGHYPSMDDAQFPLQQAKQWQSSPQTPPPFLFAIIVPDPSLSPGEPQWDLRHARGAYTVMVEVYFDPEEGRILRRHAAAQRAAELREQGVEAYYFHGHKNSIVTVGLFPENSIRTRMVNRREQQDIMDPRIVQILRARPNLLVNGRKSEVLAPNQKTGQAGWFERPTCPIRVPGSKDSDELNPEYRGRYTQPW